MFLIKKMPINKRSKLVGNNMFLDFFSLIYIIKNKRFYDSFALYVAPSTVNLGAGEYHKISVFI